MFGKKKTDKAAASDVPSKPDKPANVEKPAKAEKPAKIDKKAAKAEKAAKAVKPKKAAKKSPLKLSKSGPGFFAAHVEKMLLLIVVLGVCYFLYDGLTTPGFDESKVPEDMAQRSSDLLRQIKVDHWEAIASEHQVEHDFLGKTKETRRPTVSSDYDNGFVSAVVPTRQFEPRRDPVLLPPQDLYVVNVSGALAIEVPKDFVDPYEEWDDADKIEAKKGRRDRRGPSAGSGYGGAGYGGDGGGSGGYGAGYGGEGGYGGAMGAGAEAPPRRLSFKYDKGAKIGSAGAAGGGMYGGGGGMYGGGGYGGESGGYGSGGMGAGAMGGGMYGGSGGGMYGAGGRSRDGLDNKTRDKGPQTKLASRSLIFNSILAAVPHRKMAEEYEAAFKDSGAFVRDRDMPVYRAFELQRVDVTTDPSREVAEGEWKTISDTIEQYYWPGKQKWAARPPEPVKSREQRPSPPLAPPIADVVSPANRAPGITMPIPPILVRDYRDFSKHPALDWAWDYRPPRKKAPEPEQGDDDDSQPKLPPAAGGGSGAGGMYGSGGGGMYGSGGGYGGGMYGGESGGYGSGMYGGDGGGYGGGMYGGESGGYGSGYGGGMYGGEGGGYGGGMYGSGGGGMYGGMGGGTPSAELEPEFKMVRCYDMLDAKDLKKVYRYRLRLMMRDPNYPEDRRIPAPAPNELTNEAWARIAAIKAKDDAAIEKDAETLRTMRYTDWSEPSDPVRVAIPTEVFAGAVEFDGTKFVENVAATRTNKEATAKVVVTTFDGNTGAKFAMEIPVKRGTVLNNEGKIELIVPTSKIIKKKDKFTLNSNATIVDIRGGTPLEGDSRDDPLSTGGELLILHGDNRLETTNDLDDMFLYRMYTFQDEKEAAEKAGQTPDPGAGGYGGYGGAGYGGG